MIEVIRRVSRHSELFHDPARTDVCGHSQGHNLGKLQLFEAIAQGGAGALGSKAATPVLEGEAPADLDAGREVRLEGRVRKADEAGQFTGFAKLGGEEREPVLVEVRLASPDQIVALLSRERRRKELHHPRIGGNAEEGVAIGIAPGAQEEARGIDQRNRRRRIPSTDRTS